MALLHLSQEQLQRELEALRQERHDLITELACLPVEARRRRYVLACRADLTAGRIRLREQQLAEAAGAPQPVDNPVHQVPRAS